MEATNNNKKYKVAIISDYFMPRLGGIESHVKDLAHNLTKKGNKVRILTSTIDYENKNITSKMKYFEDKYYVEKQDGYFVDRIVTRLPFYFPYAFKSDEKIKAIIQNCDIVHIHVGVISPFSQKAVKLALDMDKPVLVTWHCILGSMEKYCQYVLDVKEWVEKGAVMSAVSTFHAKQLEETFNVPFNVLSNAIDETQWVNTNEYVKQSTTDKTQIETIKLAASMRFTFRKRVLHLIKIMHKVDKKLAVLNDFVQKIHAENIVPLKTDLKTKTFELHLFGNGPLLPIVRKLIKFYELEDKIILRGRVPKQELADSYKNTDIYVVTCLTESFGIAALEARVSGVPIVGRTNTGTTDFLTDRVNGMLAENDEKMAENIVELIENDYLREQMKQQNLSSVPKQTWGNVYKDTISLYEKAIGNIIPVKE